MAFLTFSLMIHSDDMHLHPLPSKVAFIYFFVLITRLVAVNYHLSQQSTVISLFPWWGMTKGFCMLVTSFLYSSAVILTPGPGEPQGVLAFVVV